MHYSTRHSDMSISKTLEPELFGAAFLQLDQMIERFHPMLEDDHFLQENLEAICNELKNNAVQHAPLPCESGEHVIEQLDRVSLHAREMAREEQRMVEESHDHAASEEELESAAYFELANELRLCSTQFKRNLMHAA